MIRAEQVNNTSVNISWVPGYDAHSRIIRHQLKYRYGNKSAWNYLNLNSEWRVFDLKIGSRAYFSVASENSVGVGGFSAILEVIASSKGMIQYIEIACKKYNKNTTKIQYSRVQ